jgi:hypothetical protein
MELWVEQQHANRVQPSGKTTMDLLSYRKQSPNESGTVATCDVVESEEMADPLHKVLTHAHKPLREGEGWAIKGNIKNRVCNSSKEGAAESVASGNWPRSTNQKGMAVYALEWCYRKLRESVGKSYKFKIVDVRSVRRSYYLRWCTVCIFVYLCVSVYRP